MHIYIYIKVYSIDMYIIYIYIIPLRYYNNNDCFVKVIRFWKHHFGITATKNTGFEVIQIWYF